MAPVVGRHVAAAFILSLLWRLANFSRDEISFLGLRQSFERPAAPLATIVVARGAWASHALAEDGGCGVFLFFCFFVFFFMGVGDQHCSPEPRGEAVWPGLTSSHSTPIAVT